MFLFAPSYNAMSLTSVFGRMNDWKNFFKNFIFGCAGLH